MARSKRVPGHMERRGRGFRWRVCVGGKYHRFTIATDDRLVAEDWARTKFAELSRQQVRRTDGLPVGMRVSDLLGYFEKERLPRLSTGTQGAYQDSLKPIRQFFVTLSGDSTLERVRPGHISDFLDWRRNNRLNGKQPLHNRTLAKDRAVLHRLFDVAQEREWREGNPVAKVATEKADNRQYVILTDTQYDALLTACDEPQVRLYILFCGETGCRCESEALWVRFEDIDLEDGFVTIVSGRDGHRTKGGRTRSVPLTARLLTALREYFASHRFAAYDGQRPDHVFHHTQTRRHYQAGARVGSFRRGVQSAAERAKVPGEWVLHDLRHRRATTWLAEGKSPVLVKEALGHADLRTTMGYMHLVKENLRALVDTGKPGQVTRGSSGL